MSTDKPVGAMLITEHEAGQIGRANASGRTPAVGREVRKDSADAQFGDSREP
jgi:hypothetical protein